jgi:hypothetical protein
MLIIYFFWHSFMFLLLFTLHLFSYSPSSIKLLYYSVFGIAVAVVVWKKLFYKKYF